MTTKTFFLVHAQARQRCAEFAASAPDGWRVVFSEPRRKDIQNSKMHAMMEDIARQVQHAGRYWDADDMKRFLVDDFAEEMRSAGHPLHNDTRVFPSMDGRRIVQLGIQTREFRVAEASAFIEFLYAKGAEHSVKWTEPAR